MSPCSRARRSCRYLAARHGAEALWPSDAVARAPVDQLMEWSKTSVASAVIYKIFCQMIRVSRAERNHALVDEGIAELKGLMAVADARLARHDWLVGDIMTLADISFGTSLYRYFTVPFERADLSSLRACYDRLCARTAFDEHVMVSFELLRVQDA